MGLRVLSAGPLTTVQDLGRFGFERFGVPQSGAMDEFALRAANRLVGNGPGAAALEFAVLAPSLRAEEDCLAAVTGPGYRLSIQGRAVGGWMAAWAGRGEEISVLAGGDAGWGYLAVSGGLDTPPVMGSRSTYLRGSFGGWQGRTLREGDVLPLGSQRPPGWKRLAGDWYPPDARPAYAGTAEVPVILGPQQDAFTEEAVQAFLSGTFSVSPSSDRMGYRLSGPALSKRSESELLSEPLPWGAVQVPADGQPMVMLSDRPASGGYAKIAVVARAGLPLLVQAMPGSGQVRFRAVQVEDAQALYREMLRRIETGVVGEDEVLFYGFEL